MTMRIITMTQKTLASVYVCERNQLRYSPLRKHTSRKIRGIIRNNSWKGRRVRLAACVCVYNLRMKHQRGDHGTECCSKQRAIQSLQLHVGREVNRGNRLEAKPRRPQWRCLLENIDVTMMLLRSTDGLMTTECTLCSDKLEQSEHLTFGTKNVSV